MKKLTEEDLAKGLNALTAVASHNNVAARRTELLSKANSGEATDEERDELIKSLSGNDLGQRAAAGLQTNEIKKSLDVSDYLKDLTSGIAQGLEVLGDQLSKSQEGEGNFRIALATTLVGINDVLQAQGEILKSLTAQAAQTATLPARGPKSLGVAGVPAKAIQKSFGGAQGAGASHAKPSVDLSDDQIFDAMEGLQKSGVFHVNGEDLTKAVSKYESLHQISQPVMEAVQAFVAKNAS